MTAVDIALRGEGDDVASDDVKTVTEIPCELKSVYRQLFNQAMSYGISEGVKDEVTVDELERMMVFAAIHNGLDVIKGEHTQNAGRFYAESGKIHERLKKELADGKK